MRKDIGIIGALVLSGLLLGFTPGAIAAEYSVRFGEIQGTGHETVVPTSNIKLCIKSTGYRFGYQIVPPGTGSYQYYTILYLPTPPVTVGPNLKNSSVTSEGGKEIKENARSASGPTVHWFTFDEGDPTGAWKFDVVVQKAVVATIKFDVVPASSCP